MSSWLRASFASRGDDAAVIAGDSTTTYRELAAAIDQWRDTLAPHAKKVVALEGDFARDPIAALFALIELRCVIVPLSPAAKKQRGEFLTTAECDVILSFADDERGHLTVTGRHPEHPLFDRFRARNAAGLILFSSGSTGKSKAALHDLDRLLEKFRTPRPAWRTLTFLLFDHIGGLNTLFHTLANGGTVVSIAAHDPESVCATIERHRVEILPASPTFLNLLLISEAWRRHDLSSLRRVTYGTEPMPEHVLHGIGRVLPDVELQQTYGLSELGILRSKSVSRESLWLRVGGEGIETEVRDGVLWIRTKSAMLGYLNAEAPFDENGWFNTGDVVDTDGEWLRIAGRATEQINVGGMKVDAVEVESAIMEMDNVADATVSGVPNAITGQAVRARVNLIRPEDPAAFRRRLREHCIARLPRHKVPAVVEIVEVPQFTERFKKSR